MNCGLFTKASIEKDKIHDIRYALILSYCELCSNSLGPEGVKILVDGVQLTVCKNCVKRGKIVPKNLGNSRVREKTARLPPKNDLRISDSIVLVEDYANLIRNARVQKNLTHEQLGAILKERTTLLRRFESGSLKPDLTSAAKLERFLGIRLYVSDKG